jgi:hypothetical protein
MKVCEDLDGYTYAYCDILYPMRRKGSTVGQMAISLLSLEIIIVSHYLGLVLMNNFVKDKK